MPANLLNTGEDHTPPVVIEHIWSRSHLLSLDLDSIGAGIYQASPRDIVIPVHRTGFGSVKMRPVAGKRDEVPHGCGLMNSKVSAAARRWREEIGIFIFAGIVVWRAACSRMAARYGFCGVVRFWWWSSDLVVEFGFVGSGGFFVEFGLEFVDGLLEVFDGAELAD